MSRLFHQDLFVPEDLSWFEDQLQTSDSALWGSERLEAEASLYLCSAITNWEIAPLLDRILAPPWSEELEIEAPGDVDSWAPFLLRAESVAPALAAYEEVHSGPRKLAGKLTRVLTKAGWAVDDRATQRLEAILRQKSALRDAGSDDVALALATAWAQRVEALRHAAAREAPLVCILWH